uniref:Potassium channel tetramerisation-type BTB domain-containing protein n=1 Tax=Acrobeloides nanus TaxID=290746 RepID=A0A914CWR5_9BILA
MISGEVPVTVDSEGYILVDRDGTYFNLILNFMRDGEVDLPNDEHALKLILREADYYSFQNLLNYIQQNESFDINNKAVEDPKNILKTLPEICEVMEKIKKFVVINYLEIERLDYHVEDLFDFVLKLKQFLKTYYPAVQIYYMSRPIHKDSNSDAWIEVFVDGTRIEYRPKHYSYREKSRIWMNEVERKIANVLMKAG